ncbi:GntR family transcriptional regulator [Nesterenkonia halophila]
MTDRTGLHRPTLLTDQVYETLEQQILTGVLEAGRPLRIRDVAEMAGTSVMPVREAIRRLAESGLATAQPHKGAVVRTFTAGELIEIYEVRTLLESEAAERGTLQVPALVVEQMGDACRRMRRAVDEGRVVDALDLDEQVIGMLYKASGNSVLVSMIETLWRQCRPYKLIGARKAVEHGDGSLWESQSELITAVTSGDVDGARTITELSLAGARRRLERRLE